MNVNVFLFAGLKCNNPELASHGLTEFRLELSEGATAGSLRRTLGLDPALPLLFMINNHAEPEGWPLKDGDRIGIFPPIGGG